MAEVTLEGITPTTLLEYQRQVQDAYLQIDPQWNINPESPDGQVIGIWSEQLALLDEVVVNAYISRDPATARGQALNDIAAYAGLTRLDATPSTAIVTVGGVTGTVIPAGQRIRNAETGSQWSTDEQVTIPGTVGVTSVDAGSIEAAQNTLTEIADPVAGWQTVNNDDAAALGRDEESDTAFRLRRNLSVALPSQNQVDSIFAAVGNVEGVTQVRVYENPESTVDANGISDHSIAIFVQGGEVGDVQEAIAINKNPGCGMNRNTGFLNQVQGDFLTELGNVVPITFFRPEAVTVFAQITINTSQMSESEKAAIKDAIVDYAVSGYTGGGSGFTQRGFRIGETVAAGKLFTPVNEIVGGRGYVETIFVGTTVSPTGQTVPIAFNELGVFDADNIEVIYT